MAIFSGISKALFGKPDVEASNIQMQKAREMAEKAGLLFDDLDVPTQQELINAIKYMELVPLEEAEQLGSSMMEALRTDPNILSKQQDILGKLSTIQPDIESDAELISKQRAALERLSEIGEVGLTPDEEFERSELMRQINASEQSRQKSIKRHIAETGGDVSGADMAARLLSSQTSANRAQQEGQALEAEKYKRKLAGMIAAGNLSGKMQSQDFAQALQNLQNRQSQLGQAGQYAGKLRGQDFTESATKASAADAIAKFNALQRTGAQSRNIAQQRGIAAQKTQAAQQAYENELRKKQSQAAAYTSAAQSIGKTGAEMQSGALQEWSAGPQLFSSVLSTGADFMKGSGGAAAASDINAKKNIQPGKEKIDEMLDNLESSSYEYKDPEKFGEGEQIGVMAQDMEKSALGSEHVVENMDGEGTKGIKYNEMSPTLLAAQVEQHKETKNLKTRVEQLEDMLSEFVLRRG